MPNEKKFYVYVLRDPRPDNDMQPIYVGKGKGRRAHRHWVRTNNLLLNRVFKKIRDLDLKPIIEIDDYFDNETDAFQREIELIAEYGRRNIKAGSLCNLTDGGEGVSGSLSSIEHMRKLNADPVFAKANAERARKGLRKLHADPIFAEAHAKRASELLRKLHAADPAFTAAMAERGRKQLLKLHADPEYTKARSEQMKDLHADPIFAEARNKRGRELLLKLHADPVFAERHAEKARERIRTLNADPVFAKTKAERSSESMRKLHADPIREARRIEKFKATFAAKRQAKLAQLS